MGGKVAMELALRHPGQVKKLVVVDIAPSASAPRHTEMIRAMMGLELQAFRTRTQMEDALASAIPERAVRQFLLKNVELCKNGQFRWRLNLEEIQRNYPKLNEGIPDKRRYEDPVLFIRGADSDYVTEADFPRIKELFPRGQVEVIPGAGHWVHAEAPELFTSIVLKFLQEPV
jgi:pimeloyl-ACP methyl ester carboxylesterase